jgi:hypothetical protein
MRASDVFNGFPEQILVNDSIAARGMPLVCGDPAMALEWSAAEAVNGFR